MDWFHQYGYLHKPYILRPYLVGIFTNEQYSFKIESFRTTNPANLLPIHARLARKLFFIPMTSDNGTFLIFGHVQQ